MDSLLLKGKRGLVMGVANDKSLAWAIAKMCSNSGAEVILSYQGEVLARRVEPLAESIGCKTLIMCDVTDQKSIAAAFDEIGKMFGRIDFVVHAIAFSNKDELRGRYIDTSLDNFLMTMDISCFSFTSVAKHALPLMSEGGSLCTLSYYGAEKVIPNYNVMGVAKAALEASVRYIAADLGEYGIRVNAISAGPVRTLAASGVGDFKIMLSWMEKNAPLRRNITAEEVGKTAVYLLSDLGSGVTGEVVHVDGGYHIVGMGLKENSQNSL
ncbi:Enoyl-(acyl-carrier-protein) reductase (NADH) 1 [Alphaproteobacteria bacterium]